MDTDVPATAEVGPQDAQDLVALRARRIRDLAAAALRDGNPLRANLLAEAASLMETGQLLDQAIKQSLADSPDVLKQFAKIAAVADAHLRYTKLWSRLVEIDQRRANCGKAGRRPQRGK